jgi:hypothetical protein
VPAWGKELQNEKFMIYSVRIFMHCDMWLEANIVGSLLGMKCLGKLYYIAKNVSNSSVINNALLAV